MIWVDNPNNSFSLFLLSCSLKPFISIFLSCSPYFWSISYGFGHTKSSYLPVKSCIKMSVVSVTHKWSGLAGLALAAQAHGSLSPGPGQSRSPLSGFPFSSECGLAGAGRAARARTADRLPASEIWRVERKTILRQKVYSPVESYLIKMELEDPGSGGEWMVDSGHQMSSIITILDIMRWCKKCLISNKSFKTSWSWLLVIVNIY